MTNPFASASVGKGWEWPVGMMSLILGVGISLAWISNTNRQTRLQSVDPDVAQRLVTGQIDELEFQKLTTEVRRLMEENTKYQQLMAKRGEASEALNDSLQKTKIWAGLTPVEGPGITVTLRDSTKETGLTDNDRIIHDADVLRVVNELWAAGAEAIEVNGDRMAIGSSVRCVGPVIHIDGRPIASPVMIRAIGDVSTLMGGMELPGGALDEIRQTDPDMVQLDRVKLHRFKAHTGSLTREHVKAVEDKK
jgi:uncharacterized protein YlxW (UPF0749 family)